MRTILILVQVALALLATVFFIAGFKVFPDGNSLASMLSNFAANTQLLIGGVLFVISWGLWEITRDQ